MGRRFNGSSDFLLMNLGSALGALTGGPRTYAYLATVYDQTDGAVIHTRIGSSTANADQCWWVEHAGNDWNYGQQVAARRVGDAPIGDLCVFIVRKDTGGTSVPTGRIINITAGGTITDTSPAPSALADGPAPGVTGELRIGRWGDSGSEFLNADLHALITLDRVISDAETLTLDLTAGSTWADWLALGTVGAWPFNQASATDPVPDASGNGATSTTITGTTIVADPVGFFDAGNPPVILGQALETGTAGALSRAKLRTVGQAVEMATAMALARSKRRAVGQAVETDAATALARSKRLGWAQAIETNTAASLTRTKRALLGRAVETDTAGAFVAGNVVVLGQAVDTNIATALARAKRRTLGQAVEMNTAAQLTAVVAGRPVVLRPHTGTVVRPGTGIVVRPNTGLVVRP